MVTELSKRIREEDRNAIKQFEVYRQKVNESIKLKIEIEKFSQSL